MKNDYCPYKLSLALKTAGFDEPCRDFYWTSDGTFKHTDALVHKNSISCDTMVAAPILWQAQKWLREVKHISIRVSYIPYHKVWFADWLNLDTGEFDDTDANFDTYEEALADGIAVALQLLDN